MNEQRKNQWHSEYISKGHGKEEDEAKQNGTRHFAREQTKILPGQARTNLLKKDRRHNGILAAQGFIQGRKEVCLVAAIPDTGAGYNLISASLVESLGFAKPPGRIHNGVDIRMANGKFIRTLGAVEAIWSFKNNAGETWKLVFHVLDDFVYDLVLGNEFLMATRTMSTNQHRLNRVPLPLRALSVLRVSTLGCVNQRVRGSLDGNLVEALPDSGSESSLLSWSYVTKCGWAHKIDDRDSRLLVFPDGTVERTMGTLSLRWSYGGGSEALLLDFHILHGCVYDAILGQDMLEDTDAFLQYQSSFVDNIKGNDASTMVSEFNLVIWLPFKRSDPKKRKRQDANNAPTASPAEADALGPELKRRAVAENTIMRIPDEAERKMAVLREQEIRRQFEATREHKTGLSLMATVAPWVSGQQTAFRTSQD